MAKAICSEEIKNTKIGIRHLQCLLLALGLSVAYATRVNLSIAIVAMTGLHDAKESAGVSLVVSFLGL